MDTLFQRIEIWYNKPFGSVLDTRTEEHSLQRLLSTQTQSITAIKGDPYRKKGLEFSYKEKLRTEDRILHGNWKHDDLLNRECFDIVVAGYLLGAIDGFAPYFKMELFGRLKRYMKDKIYIIGLEPYLNLVNSKGDLLMLGLSRLGDACIILSKHRSCREYLMKWMKQNLQYHSLQITQQQKLPIFYDRQFVHDSLQFCREGVIFLPLSLLKRSLFEEIANVKTKLYSLLKIYSFISFGFDYVIEAKHAN